MSIDDKFSDFLLIGTIGAAAHAAIILDRKKFRKGLAINHPKIDWSLLQAEHVVHHITQTALLGAFYNLYGISSNASNIAAPIVSATVGYFIDGKKKQWDQMVSNVIGSAIGYYFLKNYFV